MMASDLSKPAMEVPPEVLGRILAHLDKKDLKEVRLVCKQLERSAVSLLFDEVYLSTNPAEIEIAQNTVRNFAKSIKTVFFSAVEYKEMKWGHFKNGLGHYHAVEHGRLAYTNYCKLRQEQQEMFRAGTYFGHLCYVLRTIPNPQRLVISDFEASLQSQSLNWEKRRSRLWRVGDCPAHCSIQGCAYGNLRHLRDMHRPQSLLRSETKDINPWALVMMGLAATGSQIRELEIDPSHAGYVPRGGFDNTLQQPFALQDIFQHFLKLRLHFQIKKSVENHIAQTLSTATNLKSLCIIMDGHMSRGDKHRPGGPTAFQEILGECKFPRLRSLILTGFDSTEAELVGFLRGSSRLQHLTLTQHNLRRKGRWDSCANGIKAALPSIEHIIVNALESTVDSYSVDSHTHRCSCTDVQEFFFQGKANPFICPQTQDERIRVEFVTDDYDAKRREGSLVQDTLWKASYLKFH